MKNFTNFSVIKAVSLLTILMVFCFGFISYQAKAQNPEWMYFLEGVEINALVDDGDCVWVAVKTKQSFQNNVIYKLRKATGTIIDSVESECTENECLSMDVDVNGILWFTDRKSLAKYDGINLTVWNETQLAEIGLANRDIATLKVDRKGNVWLGLSMHGIAMFDGEKCSVYYPENSGIPYGSWGTTILNIEIDSEENVWITTNGGGIAKFDGNEWIPFTSKNSEIPTDSFNDLKIDSEDNVWLCTTGYGLVKFDGENCTIYNSDNSGIPENKTMYLTIDKDDKIWFWSSPLSGLIKFDGENFTAFTVQNSGIKGNRIDDLFVDSDNNLWMYATYVVNNYKGINVYKEGGVIISSVDNERINIQDIAIFPNPSSDFITIQFSNKELQPFAAGDNKVQIFDVLGIEIMSESIHSITTSHRMNVEKLPAGVYFIRIGNKVEKFVKM